MQYTTNNETTNNKVNKKINKGIMKQVFKNIYLSELFDKDDINTISNNEFKNRIKAILENKIISDDIINKFIQNENFIRYLKENLYNTEEYKALEKLNKYNIIDVINSNLENKIFKDILKSISSKEKNQLDSFSFSFSERHVLHFIRVPRLNLFPYEKKVMDANKEDYEILNHSTNRDVEGFIDDDFVYKRKYSVIIGVIIPENEKININFAEQQLTYEKNNNNYNYLGIFYKQTDWYSLNDMLDSGDLDNIHSDGEGNKELLKSEYKGYSGYGKKNLEGSKFDGMIWNGEIGEGKMTYDNGAIKSYKGHFENGKRNGKGIAHYRKNDYDEKHPIKYEGTWFKNRRYGKGITTFSDNSKEEGWYICDELKIKISDTTYEEFHKKNIVTDSGCLITSQSDYELMAENHEDNNSRLETPYGHIYTGNLIIKNKNVMHFKTKFKYVNNLSHDYLSCNKVFIFDDKKYGYQEIDSMEMEKPKKNVYHIKWNGYKEDDWSEIDEFDPTNVIIIANNEKEARDLAEEKVTGPCDNFWNNKKYTDCKLVPLTKSGIIHAGP